MYLKNVSEKKQFKSEKLDPFVKGNAAKPRCFENVKIFPTKYDYNKKSWMTSKLFYH